MEEIPNNHRGCIKLCKSWDKLPTSTGAGLQPSTAVPAFLELTRQPHVSPRLTPLNARNALVSKSLMLIRPDPRGRSGYSVHFEGKSASFHALWKTMGMFIGLFVSVCCLFGLHDPRRITAMLADYSRIFAT